MEELFELAKILLPAALALYMIYLVVKSFLNKEFQSRLSQIKIDNGKTVLPMRLQAYERMSIFLERIAPNSLVVRLNDGSFNVVQFQHVLVNEVRQEYMHNISQQIYMGDEVWSMITKAKEDTITLINSAAEELEDEKPSIELAKSIVNLAAISGTDPVMQALFAVKNEARELF